MAELHELLRRDLEIIRERASPPPGAEPRVLAAVEAIGFGPEPLEPDPDPDVGWEGAANDAAGHAGTVVQGTGQIVWAAKIVAVTLALTGAGLLAVGVTGRVILASRGSSSSVVSQVEAPAPAIAPAAPQPVSPAEPPLAEQATTPPEPTRSALPSTPRPTSIGEARAPDPLAAELALVEAARTAKDPSGALELLRQHEKTFADGLLATERELLIIEHLCELGQFEPARARDRRLFPDRRDVPQRARLVELCPELANDRGTDSSAVGHE